MYKILSESTENVVGINVSDKLTSKDYETLVPLIEKPLTNMRKLVLEHETNVPEGWLGLDRG